MNYYISDLHFCCGSEVNKGGKNYDNCPYMSLDEMHEDMLKRWNHKITNGDTVYILGDIGRRGKAISLYCLITLF